MKYGDVTLGQVEAIINKVGGMDGVKGLLSGEMMVMKKAERKFDIWTTIKLGTGLETADDFRRAMHDGGFHFNEVASAMLESPSFRVADKETEIDLVKVTVAELGFKEGTVLCKIYERAQEFRLRLCSPEVGPQAFLQYRDAFGGTWFCVAMEPIPVFLPLPLLDSSDNPYIFRVVARKGLILIGQEGSLNDFFFHDVEMVFARPRR